MTFVSRDRKWIKNIGIKTQKCDVYLCASLLTASGLRGVVLLLTGPSGVMCLDLSRREAFWVVFVSLSSSSLHKEYGVVSREK